VRSRAGRAAPREPQRRRRSLGCDVVLVITAVAPARLYRGAHFPTDVMGSALFAVPWLLVILKLLRPRAGSQSGRHRATTQPTHFAALLT
jgi:membrane-associated phospholipid phosphatase